MIPTYYFLIFVFVFVATLLIIYLNFSKLAKLGGYVSNKEILAEKIETNKALQEAVDANGEIVEVFKKLKDSMNAHLETAEELLKYKPSKPKPSRPMNDDEKWDDYWQDQYANKYMNYYFTILGIEYGDTKLMGNFLDSWAKFDWDKVDDYMRSVNWNWGNRKNRTPNIKELQQSVLSLFFSALMYTDKNNKNTKSDYYVENNHASCDSGGFIVSVNTKEEVTIEFSFNYF